VAFDSILALAGVPFLRIEGDHEIRSLRRIWQSFQKSRLSLLAEADEMEIDVILWLNRQGCCVFDTLMVMEAIEEYEKWVLIDPQEVEGFKRAFEYYEQLELFPPHPQTADGAERHERTKEILNSELLNGLGATGKEDTGESAVRLLRQCLGVLHERYHAGQWQDLRATEYQLNWEILAPCLAREGRAASFGTEDGQTNREIFGLFCRAVALSKKSCPTPSMAESHMEFVIRTVLKKYRYEKKQRYVLHLLSCVEHGIPYFITLDGELIARAAANKRIFEEYRELFPGGLQIVSPSMFEAILSP
jgi:hypothetical protein